MFFWMRLPGRLAARWMGRSSGFFTILLPVQPWSWTASIAQSSDDCRDCSWVEVSLSKNRVTNWPSTEEPWYSWVTERHSNVAVKTHCSNEFCEKGWNLKDAFKNRNTQKMVTQIPQHKSIKTFTFLTVHERTRQCSSGMGVVHTLWLTLWSESLSSKSCHHSVPTKNRNIYIYSHTVWTCRTPVSWRGDYRPILRTADRRTDDLRQPGVDQRLSGSRYDSLHSAAFLFHSFCFNSENFHSHHPAGGCREIESRREQRANVIINSQQLAGASQCVCVLFSGLQLHESRTPVPPSTSQFLSRHENKQDAS